MPRKASERRLGRPPDTDSVETRNRILRIARETFAVLGFEMTTNREIATRAGVTPAALSLLRVHLKKRSAHRSSDAPRAA